MLRKWAFLYKLGNSLSQFDKFYAMSNGEPHAEVWTPCEDVLKNYKEKSYAIVVLNCRINPNVDHRKVVNLWNNAKLRVAVDGGAQRWLNWLEAHQSEDLDAVSPDLITGDMDSLPDEVLNHFKNIHSQVIKTPDQDETDFTKALREVKKYCDRTEMKIDTIFVLGDTSGRFDQIIANINTLFKAQTFMEDIKIYQIASNSISWLLKPGQHRISIPEILREKQEWCALIPIGAPCMVSSNGLKWNLDKTKLSFGGMVSTSNTYSGEPFADVTTDGFLIFSMGIEAML